MLASLQRLAIALLVLGLTACANVATVKMPQDYAQKSKRIAVVSIAAPYPMEIGLGAGLYFGALGVLAENSSGESSRDLLARKLASQLGGWSAADRLHAQLVSQLQGKGYQVIDVPALQALPAEFAYDPAKGMGDIDTMQRAGFGWYGPDKTLFNHAAIVQQSQPDIIIEAGYGGYRIDTLMSGKYLIMSTLIKAVRADTGAVIARDRNWVATIAGGTPNHGKLGQFDLTDEGTHASFIARYKIVLEQETAQLVKESIENLGL